ncbi:zinc finger SWIM domain-containing protein 1 [Pelodytes ibericus]
MAFLLMKQLLANNPGSRINFNVGNRLNLERINIQTSMMGKVFSQYPEVLLLIRSRNDIGKVLYIFLADGPRLFADCELIRTVHIAIPTDESPESLAEMFHFLKEFNPYWPKIRIFLVDPYFKETDAITKAFPSAEIVLSAFHICKYIQQNIYKLSLPATTEKKLGNTLRNTMCSPTDENLRKMHTTLHQLIKPHLVEKLSPIWLLTDRIWALHRWRADSESLKYFEMMDNMVREINETFSKKLKLEESISMLITFIQKQTAGKAVPSLRICNPEEMSLLINTECPSVSTNTFETQASNKEPEIDTEASMLICESLNRICTPAAADLCLKEFSIVQKCSKRIVKNDNKLNIQLLEQPQEVGWECRKECTCPFFQTMKLPCRHILAALHSYKQVVKPEMFDCSWQRNDKELDATFPVPANTLKIMKGETKGIAIKQLSVDSLTNQITKLLAECSDDVFQQRYNSLRELADAWIGPYEQVKL